MLARPLRILVCGGDAPALQQIARTLNDDNVEVTTSTRIIDSLCFSQQEWDILLVDMDGLTSFLLSLLPAIRRQFSKLYMVGLSTKATADLSPPHYYGLKLDAYLSKLPKAEDLIVIFPQLAANYLCDTQPLAAPGSRPLSNLQ